MKLKPLAFLSQSAIALRMSETFKFNFNGKILKITSIELDYTGGNKWLWKAWENKFVNGSKDWRLDWNWMTLNRLVCIHKVLTQFFNGSFFDSWTKSEWLELRTLKTLVAHNLTMSSVLHNSLSNYQCDNYHKRI